MALVLGLGAAACSGDAPLQDTKSTPAALKIGIGGDKPGVAHMVAGSASGFDVDVAAYIAWKLGYSPYDIEWVKTTPSDRVEHLSNGTVDMVVSMYTITDERREQVDFAGPYLILGQDVLVRADDAITDESQLAGKRICAIKSSTGLERIKELVGDTATYQEEESSTICVSELLAGNVDAATSDDLVLAQLAAGPDAVGRLRLLGQPLSKEAIGVGLPNGSHELCESINEALTDMTHDGSWIKFIERHTIGTGYDPAIYDNPPALEPCE
jgi:glutamate transport system substrate-binding protein